MKTIRSFLAGIKNLWRWLPVVWADRQWDHWFFVKIVEHKLRLMEQFFQGSGPRLVSAARNAERVRYCRILASRIVADDYLGWVLRRHVQEWGEARCILGESRDDGSVELLEIAVPHLEGDDRKREKRLRSRLYDEARRQRDQDYRELFRLLDKYVEHWWD